MCKMTIKKSPFSGPFEATIHSHGYPTSIQAYRDAHEAYIMLEEVILGDDQAVAYVDHRDSGDQWTIYNIRTLHEFHDDIYA